MDNETVEKRVRIVQLPREVSLCTGCGGCVCVCSLLHNGNVGHHTGRIFLDRGTVDMMHTIYTCQQCVDHPCMDACPPRAGAMFEDENGIVYIDQEKCTGCKACIKACTFEPKRINYNHETKKAEKCDLCRDRAEGPACIADCQVACLQLSDEPIPVAPVWTPPGG